MKSEQRPLLDILRSPALIASDRKAFLSLAFISIAMNILLFAMPLYSL